MSKPARQQAILEMLRHGPIASQEELRQEVAQRGFQVTQATLSRDLRELSVVKTADGYTLAPAEHATEPALPALERMLRQFLLTVRQAKNLVVLKTVVGSAPPVAAAIDGEQWPEIVGTIAGDDTILIVCETDESASRLVSRVQERIA